jgi:hypothetical protein
MRPPASFTVITLLSAALVACDERGVSVGSEEPCQPEPRLLAVTASPPADLPPCARVGESRLVDGSFESPVVGDCNNGYFCQFSAPDVPAWDTTGDLQKIEVWNAPRQNIPAPDGQQFVELDASSQDTLFQDVALPPGQLMYWSFQHRGRNGVESVELLLGPPDALASQGVFESSNDGWTPNSGLYVVGKGEAVTRFALASRSGTSEGNFVDAVVFAPVQ